MWKIYFLLLRRQNWTCVRNGGIEKMTRNPPRICFLWGISTRNQIACLAGMFTFPSFFPSSSLQKCQIHWKLKEERDLKVWNCRFYLFTKFIEVMIGLFYKIQSNQTLYLTLSRWSEQIQFFSPSTVLILFYLKTWYQALTYLVGLYKVCGPAPSPTQTPKKLYGFEDGNLWKINNY